LVSLADPPVRMRAYAVTRRGRDQWPPLRAVLHRITRAAAGTGTTD
jgi:hypothetical protein